MGDRRIRAGQGSGVPAAGRPPGVSLLANLQRRHQLRPRPTRRSTTVIVTIAGAVALLLAGMLWRTAGPLDAAVAAVVAVVAAAVVGLIRRRSGPGDAGVRMLRAQLAAERRVARLLDVLVPFGWAVLHDRVLPSGGGRMAHLLTGPAGLVVVTPLPVRSGLRVTPQGLYDGDRPLDGWFATRRWEVAALAEAVAAQLPEGWVVTARAVVVPVGATAWPPLTGWGEVAVCEPSAEAIAHHVLSQPAPLSRIDAAYLAAVAEATLAPAG